MSDFYEKTTAALDRILLPKENFDVIKRKLTVAGTEGTMYFIDGFAKDAIMSKMMEFLISASTPKDCIYNIPYVEADTTNDIDSLIKAVMSGACAFCVKGIGDAAIIDSRTYPTRAIQEPENDRVLRGPRDGFTETLIFNTALIRRRIRDPKLKMQIFSVGHSTKTDIVLSYIDGRADEKTVKAISDKIKAINVDSLSMGQESLAECLIKKSWYNPFPKIRYSERPDAAAAMLLEGSIIVICDNSPSVMILPTSIFDFLQESDDFYFPPLVGSYLRITRMLTFFIALFLTPVWYLLISNPDWLPPWLEFVLIAEPAKVPVILQLFLTEFAIDGLKLASLNTPSMLNNSLSVVGALILGDFAVETGWFCPQVILYMAMTPTRSPRSLQCWAISPTGR